MTQYARRSWDAARGKWRIRAVRGGKWWRERGTKGLSMLPHLFTLMNLAFGVISILLTIQGNYRWASLVIAGSLFADGLDGRLARLLKADGEFGKELDSLADVVSFGTAPAILLYQVKLQQLGYYGMAFVLLFPMCGALRLARFNIVKTSGFFMGVPITAAGTFLACFTFYLLPESTPDPVVYLIAALVLILSFLMISTIPYPDLKKFGRRGEGPGLAGWAGPVLAMAWVLVSSGLSPYALLLLPLIGYITVGPWLFLLRRLGWNAKPAGAGQ